MGNIFEDDQTDSRVDNQQTAGANTWDSDNQAEREAGRDSSGKTRIVSVKGGGRGKQNNPGNFANDRARASAAGRKGGEARGRHHHQQH